MNLKNKLQIEAKTWRKDAHGLYDYDSSDLSIQTLIVSGSCNFFNN